MDGRRLGTGTVHTTQLDGTRGHTDADGFHHVIEVTVSKTNSSVGLRLVQDGSQGGSRCLFTEITVETLSETWSEFERVETIHGKKPPPGR